MPLTSDTSALHGVCESEYAGVLCKNEEIFDQKLENEVYHVAMTVLSVKKDSSDDLLRTHHAKQSISGINGFR